MLHLNCSQLDLKRLRLSVGSFGFGSLADAVTPPALARLQSEARECSGSAAVARQSATVDYQASIASLGPVSRQFLVGAEMIALLLSVFEEHVAPTEERSCFTFYKEGDHLGPHLDQPEAECMITAILYLAVSRPFKESPRSGPALQIYGQEMSPGRKPRLTIPTQTGSLVVGRGSRFWHERPMLGAGEHVTALTACYGRTPS